MQIRYNFEKKLFLNSLVTTIMSVTKKCGLKEKKMRLRLDEKNEEQAIESNE